MKKIILTIGICCLFGFIANTAVAGVRPTAPGTIIPLKPVASIPDAR